MERRPSSGRCPCALHPGFFSLHKLNRVGPCELRQDRVTLLLQKAKPPDEPVCGFSAFAFIREFRGGRQGRHGRGEGVLVGGERDEVQERHQPDAQQEERCDVAERDVVLREEVEPQQVVRQGKSTADQEALVRQLDGGEGCEQRCIHAVAQHAKQEQEERQVFKQHEQHVDDQDSRDGPTDDLLCEDSVLLNQLRKVVKATCQADGAEHKRHQGSQPS
mmetsp:Transcript_27987/g.70238  ORF Transcript_27987/g.70238 Transcript_27987/m.70238 type:complete len:219 (+) Transcript_27987:223-879(+)